MLSLLQRAKRYVVLDSDDENSLDEMNKPGKVSLRYRRS